MGASRHDERAAWRDGEPAAGGPWPADPGTDVRGLGDPDPALDDPDLDDPDLDDPDLDDPDLDPDIDPDLDEPGSADPFVTIRTCTPRLARRRPRRLRGPGYRPSR